MLIYWLESKSYALLKMATPVIPALAPGSTNLRGFVCTFVQFALRARFFFSDGRLRTTEPGLLPVITRQ